MAFITIEGADGVGKTTLINGLKEYFQNKQVVFTREPGGSAYAEQIRKLILDRSAEVRTDPVTEILLFFAARSNHCEYTIRPALKSGKLVICDRYIDSTYAYQTAFKRLPSELTRIRDVIHQLANPLFNVIIPDVTFVLVASQESRLKRRAQRAGTDAIESRGDDYSERVAQYYEKIANSGGRYIAVNAEMTPIQVRDTVVAQIESRFGKSFEA